MEKKKRNSRKDKRVEQQQNNYNKQSWRDRQDKKKNKAQKKKKKRTRGPGRRKKTTHSNPAQHTPNITNPPHPSPPPIKKKHAVLHLVSRQCLRALPARRHLRFLRESSEPPRDRHREVSQPRHHPILASLDGILGPDELLQEQLELWDVSLVHRLLVSWLADWSVCWLIGRSVG